MILSLDRQGPALAAAFLVVLSGPTPPASQPAQMACQDVETFAWSGFSIDRVEEVGATDAVPSHCKVQGTIDREIHFELLLPDQAAWNGRFLMGGGGGFVGSVENQALLLSDGPHLLARGFATVGTDTGHSGSAIDASWALDRPDRVVNFGFRSVHVTAEAAKTIIRLYYGKDIDHSYFLGCSRGGGQAMMSTQRYPDDFDGVIAAAPAFNWTAIGAQFVQTSRPSIPT